MDEEFDGTPDAEDMFPWPDVDASRRSGSLQRRHDPASAQAQYGPRARPCPACHRPASELSWFYFNSPRRTWQQLCGRAGWMVVCDHCHRQVAFFTEVMN